MNKLKKRVGYVAAGAGATLLMVLATVVNEPATLPMILYLDGHDGITKSVAPGALGQPVAVTEPIYNGIHNNIPPLAYCGRADDTGRWWGICLGAGKRSSSWIGPPPLEPCTKEVQRLRRMQGGYGCARDLAGVAGWRGVWRHEARP